VARFATTAPPGTPVSQWPELAALLRERAPIFAVTATRAESFGGQTGFFLVESADFGREGSAAGYLAVFVPRGWLTLSLGDSAEELSVALAGVQVAGRLTADPAAERSFDAHGRMWRVGVGLPSETALQAALPWLAVGWPSAVAILILLIVGVIQRGRRAERAVQRIFEVAPDLLGVAGFDGYFKRVNPAFERTLGYSSAELLGTPFMELVHPDDRDATREAFEQLVGGSGIREFENRYVRKDGSVCWLEWSTWPVPAERLMYGAARDVTERRELLAQTRELVEEQAAQLRVATLVAGGPAPEEVFAAVAREVALLLGLALTEIVRYDGEGSATVIGAYGDHPFPVGSRWKLADPSVMKLVRETGRPARIDDYRGLGGPVAESARGAGFRSAIGAPITVDGRTWGCIIAISTSPEPIPEASEDRLGEFTELVATAIANAESREALARLAAEQAALRRVATLVASGVEPGPVFEAVPREANALLGADIAAVVRFEDDGAVTVMGALGGPHPPGARVQVDPDYVVAAVQLTGQPARFDRDDRGGDVPSVVQDWGVRSALAAPIVVAGEVWGAMTIASLAHALPGDADRRLTDFTDLVATAIASAQWTTELAASRRRIVAASDEARRKIERDLHDGTQQRLVSLALNVHALASTVPPKLHTVRDELAALATGLGDAVGELRELASGIHPAILSEGGLGPALRALARRSSIPVEVDVALEGRLPEQIEIAAYFIVSEALANAAKHARASHIQVAITPREGAVVLTIRDDGVGGAKPGAGSGLTGLVDRVEALGGTIRITSPPGAGTEIAVELPAAETAVSVRGRNPTESEATPPNR
jgi:PAS domain S-box-containing protein